MWIQNAMRSEAGATDMKLTVNGEALDVQRHTAQAMASRREVETALGADQGYDGHYVAVDQECQRCAADGARTAGGHTPRLRVRIPDGSLGYAIICQLLGEVRASP